MNKPKLKKLLTFLVCLTLIMSVCLLTACNKDTEEEESTETITRTPSFTNGNFESYEDADETAYPYSPDNFTGSPTANVTSDDDTTIVDLNNIVKGIINLADYDSYKANWNNLDAISKNENYADDDDKVNYGDDNVLMIYNKEKAYYFYRSDSFTVSANTKYKITVDVLTTALEGGENKGATLKITGSSSLIATEGYAEFNSINTSGSWETYTFYIIGKASGSTTLDLQLMLGNNSGSDDTLTKGYAFFDNIRMTTVDEVATGAKIKTIDLKTPNDQFDYSTSASLPYLYTKGSTDSNANYDVINLSDGTSELKFDSYTLVNPGYAKDGETVIDNDKHNAYVIYNTADAHMGFYTSSTTYLTRGGKYAISLAINTKYVESGKAYFGVGTDTDIDECTLVEIDADKEWAVYTIYVYVNENTSSSMYIHFGLGKDSDNVANGYAFFDVLTIDALDNIPIEKGEEGYDDLVIDERLDAGANIIKDADWSAFEIDSSSGITASATISQLDASVTLPYESTAFDKTKNFKVSAENPTIYKLGYVYSSLSANTYYRFSIWVKTVDVQSGAGVVLTVYDGDLTVNNDATAIATYSAVVTAEDLADSTSSLNGYRELVTYFHTSKDAQAVTFTLSFGSGTQWTYSTLFDGDAYIVNASLVETEYSKYNSASSSGTYEKKYDWNETLSSSFTNGQFDTYDYSSTKGLNNGGKVDEEFQKTEFGVPSSWTLKGDTDYVTAGIVDVTNTALLGNLGITADDIGVLKYSDTLDIEKYGTFIGGNTVLMLKADDATGLVQKTVKAGYVSSSVTLSANTTYKISVLVKVVSGTANVFLSSDNNTAETNDESKFEITDTSVCTETNGWKRYTFNVSVGFSSVTAKLNLYLGALDNDVELSDSNMTADENGGYVKETSGKYVVYSSSNSDHATLPRYKYAGTAKGGLVYFDYVTMTTVDEDSATAAGDTSYEETKELEMKVDGFGLSSTYDAGTYQTPSSWTKTLGSNIDTDNNKYGVLVGGTDNMAAKSGENCLAINIPNTAGAIYYTMTSAKTFETETYYKVSVWAKTINVSGGKAYIKLSVTDYDTQSIYLDANTEWTQYTFFVKTPSADDKFGDNAEELSVKVVLGLGETSTDDESLATGIALFDDVLIEEVTDSDVATQYTTFVESAKTDATLCAYNYLSLDPEEEVDPEDEPEESEDDDTNYNWVIFMSVAFGAIIVVVVIIYFVKKYLPKRKEKKANENKTTKKKEDDYKDLKD